MMAITRYMTAATRKGYSVVVDTSAGSRIVAGPYAARATADGQLDAANALAAESRRVAWLPSDTGTAVRQVVQDMAAYDREDASRG